MRFSRPELLWALAAAAVLLPLFTAWALRSGDRARARLLATDLVPKLVRGWDAGRRRTKIVLQTAGILLILFALAGPRVGSREITVKRRGIDLMVCIDTSQSMMAQDVRPSRMVKARRQVSAFLDRLDGDRVGLVAFAGSAFLQCPLTVDYGAARLFLDVMDVHSVSTPGTNLGAAIRTALGAFGEGEDKYRAIILVTDGEDLGGEGLRAAEEAARRGIRIYTIGVGSESGEPIPVPREEGGGYKKDRQGEIVMTAMDPESLERIALETGGEFHRATTGELELDRIYDSLASLEERELATRSFTAYEERFQVPLGLGLLLLLIDFALPSRVRSKREWEGRFA
ncbi:VWA domain-containing protein [bacterium]|nr:VWA domain-containing protein [bacterium]